MLLKNIYIYYLPLKETSDTVLDISSDEENVSSKSTIHRANSLPADLNAIIQAVIQEYQSKMTQGKSLGFRGIPCFGHP